MSDYNDYINSEILCQHMKRQKVTISSLANAMAMSRQSVSHVLHGKNHPSLYMIRLMVEHLQLTKEECWEIFIKGSPEMPPKHRIYCNRKQ